VAFMLIENRHPGQNLKFFLINTGLRPAYNYSNVIGKAQKT
jgi:hypothetical protein